MADSDTPRTPMSDPAPATTQHRGQAALSALHSTIVQLGPIASGLVGLAGFGYLIGWIRASSYFDQFGAKWMLVQLGPGEILQFSMLPLTVFLGVLLFLLLYLADETFTPKSVDSFGEWAVVIAALALVIQVTPVASRYPDASLAFAQLSNLFWFVAAAARLSVVFYRLPDRGYQWTPPALSFAVYLLFIGLYQGPSFLGAAEGKVASDPSRSDLPFVFVKHEEEPRRLIWTSGDLAYLAILQEEHRHARVEPVPFANIRYVIHHTGFARATPPIAPTQQPGKE